MRRTILDELNAITDQKLDEEVGLPGRKEIVYLLKEAQVVLFPEFFSFSDLTQEEAFYELQASLEKEIRLVKERLCEECDCARKLVDQFISQLPEVKRLLMSDIQAIYDGDPAARSKAEIVLCYPGFYAISIYRIAHVLYTLGIPYIPRVMSEYAHEKTGIDINPGATIGEAFCIDHGTGIVIGETATIGRHVKLYQGVTIGARSFELDEEGNPVKSGKRHPDIGDNVIIYANATILGGDTHVGNRSVIGGNVWLIHSVPQDTKLYYKN
ncbi:MAG: serine O-acetyltransferase [Bulleidia sp.]